MAKGNAKSKKSKSQPVERLRSGPVKAAIWKNESEKGVFFSVTFSRTYKDAEGEFHDVESFSGTQLLQLGKLATEAYDRATALMRAERQAEAESEETAEESEAA